MKILLTSAFYDPYFYGGAETSVQIMAEELKNDGVEPVVLTTGPEDEIREVHGVKVYYVKNANLYWAYDSKKQSKLKRFLWHVLDSRNLRLKDKVKNIIAVERLSVVHTNTLLGFSVAVWDAARACHVPIVHTLRDYYLTCWRSSRFRNQKNCQGQCVDCGILSYPKKKVFTRTRCRRGDQSPYLRRAFKPGILPKCETKNRDSESHSTQDFVSKFSQNYKKRGESSNLWVCGPAVSIKRH